MNKMHTPYTSIEDDIIWATIHNRPTGSTLQNAVNNVMDQIHNRPAAGLLARYYSLKRAGDKMEFEYKKSKIEIPTQTLDEIIGKVEAIKVEATNILAERDQLRTDLSTARNTINYQKKRILELEEDQQAFLRLMDKARAIGTAEVLG